MNETKDIDWWQKYKKDILDVGLDTECGTVVGLSEGLLEYKNIKGKHIPVRTKKDGALPQAAYDGCAARLCNYPELNEYVFKKQPKSWLCGVVEEAFIGHAANENIRRTGASGGILSAILIHLLESKEITGAVCMKTGNQNPWESEPFIAHSKEEILECAGSVYSATPMNTILSELEN